jgi:spore photoproduct lyase
MNTFKEGKKKVLEVPKRGEALGRCATLNSKYLCCNVNVLRSVHNCPFECSYCFLQNYLNDGTTKIVDDTQALMEEVRAKIHNEPSKLFRIGTWELGDSLALDPKTGQAAKLITEFARLKNAVLELKTKSDCIDQILDIDHRQKTIVSWSLNTEYVIRSEESGTASLDRRITSIHKTVDAGYLIGLHFDPMIYHDGWEDGYKTLIKEVFSAVPADRVAWISIGSLRFNPEMKKKIENNYPDSRLTSAEMVLGDDSKVRYVKPLRVRMYKLLNQELNKHISQTNLVYLCMERWDVWDKVLGYHPESIEHLDYIFARSLYERYGIGDVPPDIKHYIKQSHQK